MDDPLPPDPEKAARHQQKIARRQQRAQERDEKQARREERQLKRQRKQDPESTAPASAATASAAASVGGAEGEEEDEAARQKRWQSQDDALFSQLTETSTLRGAQATAAASAAATAEAAAAAAALVSASDLSQKPLRVADQRKAKPTLGDAGASWRMLKLKRTKEAAAESGRNIEDVAMERYGSLEDYAFALEEEQYMRERHRLPRQHHQHRHHQDQQSQPHHHHHHHHQHKEKERPTSASYSTPLQASKFKRPSTTSSSRSQSSSALPSAVNSPRPDHPLGSDDETKRHRGDSGKEEEQERPFTPGATVLRTVVQTETKATPVDADTLNVYKAKMIKAELMGSEAEYRKYHALYQEALDASANAARKPTVSGVDSRGKMMESRAQHAEERRPTSLKDMLRREEEDDDDDNEPNDAKDDMHTSLAAMVREERLSGNDYDRSMAKMIGRDKVYSTNTDELDDRITNGETPSATTFGVHDPKRSRDLLHGKIHRQKKGGHTFGTSSSGMPALGSGKGAQHEQRCSFCPQHLRRPVVAQGFRTSLILSIAEDMVDKTCYILPHEHVAATHTLDEDVWTEIRNFMKCLLKAAMSRDLAYIFAETVTNIHGRHHTMIECIPVSTDDYLHAKAAFAEALKEEGGEWSQHNKIIDTQKRGFLRSLPSDFPYYHVWLDGIDGGLGHIIETAHQKRRKDALNSGTNAMSSRREDHEDLEDLEMAAKEGFPLDFTRRVVAGMLELDPLAHRQKPNLPYAENQARLKTFQAWFSDFDWTKAYSN